MLDGLSLRAERGALTAVLGPERRRQDHAAALLHRPDPAAERPGPGARRAAPARARLRARVGLMPQSTGAWSAIRTAELLHYLAGLYAHPLDVDALIERLRLRDIARVRRTAG